MMYLLLAACLWGAIGPVSKFVFATGITPLETAFWRGTVAGIAYLIHYTACSFRRQPNEKPASAIAWDRSQLLTMIAFGVFGVGLLEGSFVYAVDQGGAALASVLLYSAPIWVNLFGWRFFGEQIKPRQWAALACTFIGVAGVCLWGSNVSYSTPAILWGLASGLSYALFYIAGKIFFRTSHPVAVYMIAFPVGSLAMLPVLQTVNDISPIQLLERLAAAPMQAILPLLGIGLASTYLPYLLYAAGLKRVDTGKAAIITTVEPIVSVALASWLWGESFSTVGYIFCGLVLTGVAIIH